jgi:hypothetical protein
MAGRRVSRRSRAPRLICASAVVASIALGGCGGGGAESAGVEPPPPPPPPPAEAVTPVEALSAGYCASLPAANGGDRDLQSAVATFAGRQCGKYAVSCGGGDVDDMNFFAAVVPPATAPPRGTILSFSGEAGHGFHTENVQEYAGAGFRVVMIAWESQFQPSGYYQAWQCATEDCARYVDAGDPGPKESACRPAEIVRYFKELYDPDNELAYCAQGHSAGSSQIAYALAHHGADAYLDYVQLTGWTPFARPDYGCDPDRYNATGRRNYAGENPDGTMQEVTGRPFAYDATADFARELIDQVFGLQPNECGANPARGVSDGTFARLGAGGIVSNGADYVHPNTVVDAFACASDESMVDGNGAWYFERVRDANPGQVFMQTVLPGTGIPRNCVGEEVWWMSDLTTPSPIRQLTIDRMINSCVLLH